MFEVTAAYHGYSDLANAFDVSIEAREEWSDGE